jgi:hypothetical protein
VPAKRYQPPVEQPPAFFVGLAPRLAFHLNPLGLLARAIGRIVALRDNALEAQAIGHGKQLEAIIKAFGVAQPAGGPLSCL